jgi:hypothetical protein
MQRSGRPNFQILLHMPMEYECFSWCMNQQKLFHTRCRSFFYTLLLPPLTLELSCPSQIKDVEYFQASIVCVYVVRKWKHTRYEIVGAMHIQSVDSVPTKGESWLVVADLAHSQSLGMAYLWQWWFSHQAFLVIHLLMGYSPIKFMQFLTIIGM